MGGSTQKTKTTNQAIGFNAPFAPAMPGLQRVLNTADALYGPQNQYTQNAFNAANTMADTANVGGMYLRNALDNSILDANQLRYDRGYTPEMRAAMEQMGGIEGVSGPSYAEQNLAGMAQGDYLTGNPYLGDVIANSSRDIREAANENASGLGRYGSGAHDSVLARQIGDMSAGLRYNDFANQQQQMMAANQMMDANRYAGLDRQIGLASNMFNMAQAGLANQQGAYDRIGSLAGQIQGLQAAGMQAGRDAANYQTQDLQNYAYFPMGIGGMGGMQAQFQAGEQEKPGQSPLQQIAGLGTAALGLFG